MNINTIKYKVGRLSGGDLRISINKYPYKIFLTLIVFCSAFVLAIPPSWKINDDNYSIMFDTRGASGTIKGLKGSIHFDEAHIAQSSFDVTVDVNTIDTGMGLKNRHAKGEGFLNVEKYPTIKFTSTKIEKTNKGYQTTGILKIKGVTKKITIPFHFTKNGQKGNFKGSFEINRTDYDLHKFGIGEIIKIELNLPVTNT